MDAAVETAHCRSLGCRGQSKCLLCPGYWVSSQQRAVRRAVLNAIAAKNGSPSKMANCPLHRAVVAPSAPTAPPSTPINFFNSEDSNKGREGMSARRTARRASWDCRKCKSKNEELGEVCAKCGWRRTVVPRARRTYKKCKVCGAENHVRRLCCSTCFASRNAK